MTRAITISELLRLRMLSQLISTPGADVVAATRRLLAIQAQDFGQANWALGLRATGATRVSVTEALRERRVVRSSPIRGTLHFVAPEDLHWMLRLTAPRTISSAMTQHRKLGLDQDTVDRAAEVATTDLSGGGAATRAEFFALLHGAGISTTGQRGYHIIFHLAQRGLLCWGPPFGTAQALVLLHEWAPEQRRLSHTDALREFALRYFNGHGPATLADFAWWSKLTMVDARAGLALAKDELTELSLDGDSYWIATEIFQESARPASGAGSGGRFGRTVHALPGFDEYLLGYRDRSHALPAEYADRIVPGKNGIFLPTIVTRGTIAGTWTRATASARLTVTPHPFASLSARDCAGFTRAAKAYGRFMGMPATVASGADVL